MLCPKCRYQRKATDQTPAWQCPACGVAYAKAGVYPPRPIIPASQRARVRNTYGQRRGIDHLLSFLVVLSISSFALALWLKDQLPAPTHLVPELTQAPVQTATHHPPFVFNYHSEGYLIEPVAEYELWGLVVTHNNITGITDIMHTKDSVDIKDICVIWGGNIGNSDYQKISFSSGDFICYFQYPAGVSFAFDEISNNHLLSDDEVVRETIRQTHIGDQIHLRGMLVNYSWQSKPGWVRRTSTTRQDTGNGACEVVFVKEFEVLKATNQPWHHLYRISGWMIALSLLLKIGSFLLPTR
ncbi:MAG: hypothetical protein HY080_16270 [Gammaproteobacteria bacterium]|nr:hypothetical protein [Gammaproteobacteria bacterium]